MRVQNYGEVRNNDYVVVTETKLDEIDSIDYTNLILKQSRINCALNKIKDNLSRNKVQTDTVFFSYFGIDEKSNEIESDCTNMEVPPYCRQKKTAKKKTCSECKEICSLTMDMILHPTNPISQADIYEELRVHCHPSSRKILDGQIERMRTTKEAAEELADHYVYAHKRKRPLF